MDILFIVKDIDFIEPIGLMSVSAAGRKAGHGCHLGIAARDDIPGLIRRIKPRVIAYSATTGAHNFYVRLNSRIKSLFPGIFTVLGGPHATFCPSFVGSESFDCLCRGEGEAAFTELLAAVESGAPLSSIRNIAVPGGALPAVRGLVEDLDSLAFPDRALLYKRTEMGSAPLKSFITSRGCPYSCSYCFNHAFRQLYAGKGSPVRRHSVDYVIDQIRAVRKSYPLEFIKFYDDVFCLRPDAWLEEFSRKYPRLVGLPFHCLARADCMTAELAGLLRQAGCRSISISIESGNRRFREEMLHRDMDDSVIIRAFDLCRGRGISTFSNTIIGLPFARLEDEIDSLDLNLRCRVSFAEFPIFHPYPGTELGDFCVAKGIFDPDYSRMHASYMYASPLSCFSKRQKMRQRNLSLLSPVVVLVPPLRRVVAGFLIHLPLRPVYLLWYYLAKAYMVHRRIYPVRMPFLALWRMAKKSLRLEVRKHSAEKPAGAL